MHFIGFVSDRGDDTAACGRWNPDAVTGNLSAVTCRRCKATNSYRVSLSMPHGRLLANYHKDIPP